jgi:hypothetical protein
LTCWLYLALSFLLKILALFIITIAYIANNVNAFRGV